MHRLLSRRFGGPVEVSVGRRISGGCVLTLRSGVGSSDSGPFVVRCLAPSLGGYELGMMRARRAAAVVVGIYGGVAILSIVGQLLSVGRPVGIALIAVGAVVGALAGWHDAVGLRPRSAKADRETMLGWMIFAGLVVGVGGLALPEPGNVVVPLAGFGFFIWSVARLILAGWNEAAPEQAASQSASHR